jgi:hypothetical protein
VEDVLCEGGAVLEVKPAPGGIGIDAALDEGGDTGQWVHG